MGKSRLIWVVFFLTWSGLVAAADVLTLQFRSAKLSEVIEGVVKGLLGRDYVLTSGVAGMESPVTLSVRDVPKDQLLTLLRTVAESYGVAINEKGGILYVERLVSPSFSSVAESRKPEVFPVASGVPVSAPLVGPWNNLQIPQIDTSGHEARVYFPKHRSVDYLSLAVRAAGAHLADSMPGFVGNQPMLMPGGGAIYGGMPAPIYGASSSSTNLRKDVLVYTGSPEVLVKAEALISQLDRPQVAVQLKAAVLEVTDNTESVRSLSGVLNLLGGRLGITLNNGRAASNSVALKDMNLQAVLTAVDGDSRFRYLTEPTLHVLDGETARLTVGQDVPIRGAVTIDKNGNSLQSIDYRTAGLVLEVSPIVYENVTRLKILQQISNFTTTTTSGIDSPSVMRREAQTVVQADDGALIALAGLDEDRETKTTSGLSFLPSWFNSRNDNRVRSQILILLEVKKVPAAI